jgi:hypothetical protein
VLGVQGRQDPDHRGARTLRGGDPVGVQQRGAQLLGHLGEHGAHQLVRRHVHLQVEQAQFGLEVPGGDLVEHLRVDHRRAALRVDQDQFELDPAQFAAALEAVLGQHALEHLLAGAQPAAEPGPVHAVEDQIRHRDAIAHRLSLPSSRGRAALDLCTQVPAARALHTAVHGGARARRVRRRGARARRRVQE